jgi:hypothetical protein
MVNDDIKAHSKGEISQSTPEALPSPTENVSETSSSAVEPVSIHHVSPIASLCLLRKLILHQIKIQSQ